MHKCTINMHCWTSSLSQVYTTQEILKSHTHEHVCQWQWATVVDPPFTCCLHSCCVTSMWILQSSMQWQHWAAMTNLSDSLWRPSLIQQFCDCPSRLRKTLGYRMLGAPNASKYGTQMLTSKLSWCNKLSDMVFCNREMLFTSCYLCE